MLEYLTREEGRSKETEKQITMEGSCSSSYENPYPYPSHVCTPNIVTMKLSGQDTYNVWKIQMMCLLESHDMLSFIQPRASGKENHQFSRRSDALVKGWILGSLSNQTLKYVVNSFPNTDFTAKEAWDKLQTIYYCPGVQTDHDGNPQESSTRRVERTEETIKQETEAEERERYQAAAKRQRIEGKAQELYAATLSKNFGLIEDLLKQEEITLRDKITINGNTALHVAVGTHYNKEFLENMLNLATKDNQQQLRMQNSEGSTILHVAAIVGNTEAAKLLVDEHTYLLNAKDIEGQTPVAKALSNMHTDTYLYLWDRYLHFQDMEMGYLIGGSGATEFLVNLISSKDYVLAWDFKKKITVLVPSDIHNVLMAIAQNFPPYVNFLEGRKLLCAVVPVTFKFIQATKRKADAYCCANMLLHSICVSIRNRSESRTLHDIYNNAILEATRQNANEVVEILVNQFPNAIWSTNEDGHNIIQYAVLNRSEKVYNLIYQMSEHRNIYRTIEDPFGNNLLHLAARLAPANKLNLKSGAALQIQLELQWFKEVERFVCPLNVIQKNCFGETPQMVFTKEHKELITEGEKWMKETAQSYTITAALITTIVFAAAITVPGGNKQDNGIPLFTNKTAFTIFAVSNAISLFTSVTSLLMFLSILTARFSEQDFLVKLPTKLIIGLANLFISTTAMLVAFGATLFLVFGHNNSWILAPIVALTCLPITSFMTLQFPLIYDLTSATFGRSMFGKKSDRPFY